MNITTLNFSIRKLKTDDWQIMKQIRLEALRLHPHFFWPMQDEFKFTDADWKERLSNPNGTNFGLFNEKNEIIGLTGIFRDQNDRSLAWLVASYIQAAYRRMGLTRLLYEARIAWAKEQGDIHSLCLHHREDNEASRRSHQKFNFEFIKMHPPETWPNGEIKSAVEYRLKIR